MKRARKSRFEHSNAILVKKILDPKTLLFARHFFDGDEVGHTPTLLPPSVIPTMGADTDLPMSFYGRAMNLLAYLNSRVGLLLADAVFSTFQWAHLWQLPAYSTAIRGIQLHLANTNEYLDVARYRAPDTIHIGGFHLKEPQQLPQVSCESFT